MERPTYRLSSTAASQTTRAKFFRLLLAIAAILVVASAAQAQVKSDDFNAGTLDPIWTFVDPLGDSALDLTGGTSADITAPLGLHDFYGLPNTLPRISQAIGDVDFEFVVKFDSDLASSADYRTQGILLQESADKAIRIEYHNLDGLQRVFVATVPAGVEKAKVNVTTVTAPMYLRVTRVGDAITVGYSDDGGPNDFTEVANFEDESVIVNDISLYAGSSEYQSHTANVDFFRVVESCGDEVIEGFEECDEGTANGTASSCCSATCGFKVVETLCRGSVDACDIAEVCSGSDSACPEDVVQDAGFVCNAGSGDVCDPDETCSGVAGETCPADVVAQSDFVCNAGSGDVCDPDEACSGVAGETCPADVVAQSDFVCNAGSGDVCDPDETCSGVAGETCPADLVAQSDFVCNAGSGDMCDPDEACSGVAGETCPAEVVAQSDFVCNAGSGDVCDPDETCSGVAGETCPADQIASAGVECGDECLMDAFCDGGGLCAGGRLSVPAPDSCDVIDNSLYFTAAARDVVVRGDLVYVAALGAGLRIVDFSDPETPVETAFYDPPTCLNDGIPVPFEAEDVVLSGSTLYLSAGECGVLVFDTNFVIDDNTVPVTIDTDGLAYCAQPSGDAAYTAVFDSGVALLDLVTQTQIDSYAASGTLFGSVDLELLGARAIVATGAGLAIVEDYTPGGLGVVGSYESGNEGDGSSQDVELVRKPGENLAYLVRLLDGVDVLDISDPSNITLLANVPSAQASTTGSYQISISGSRAVIAEGDGGIGVLDLTDPNAPQSLGAFPNEGLTLDVEMNDQFAFVGFETDPLGGGLRIVQLERIGVDPTFVPEPDRVLGCLVSLTAIGALMRRSRNPRR